MRAGGCTVQQGLTAEAASVVKQAMTLAKRRGHAQVTPLHVANTMLSASTGLLRTACLQSHSHPLQCKALELCFNVALNRLPASNSSPMLGAHHSHHPSISNALVAAFKRAQAHQRRGSIENQQQPLLAVKIELEQLIISILDDPSVSRVMREAGFSSTQVKSNVEQAVSLEICSQTQSQTAPSVSSNKSKESNLLVLSQSPTISQQVGSNNNKVVGNPVELSDPIIRNEDVESVVESLLNKRRKSIVVVGECLASIEGVVRGVKDKVDKEDVPEALREVKFISLSLSSFGQHSRVQVEQKLVELKNLLRSCVGKGVILYLGDLKWTTEYRACSSEQGRGYYCPVEHMIMELGKLVCGIGENAKFWLMGIATFQTYMRCKSGHPSLETVWGIHPLTIPAGSLRLSLVTADSDPKSESTSKTDKNGTNSLIVEVGGGDKQLTCCAECSAKFEVEARSFQSTSCNSDSTTSTLPAWLQHCKNETKLAPTNDQHNSCVPVSELCKKWNSICNSMHRQPNCSEKTLTFSSVSPSSSASGFSYEQQNPNYLHQSQSWREHHFWIPADNKTVEPSLRMYIPEHNNKEYPKQPFLSSNPNSTPTSASSSDAMETEYSHKFKELNAENLKTLCNALERKVPWQKDIIPEIASTILKCRSGMVRRKEKVVVQGGNININEVKEETWLFFQGVDMEAKEKIARELAKLVFGSQTNLFSIALSSFSSTRADSTDHYCRNKRSRDEQSCSYIERFADAVSHNPHRVFLIEDVEQADYCSQMGFKRAMERGRITNSSGEEAGLGDAIIILSCESFSSRSRACSPPIKQKSDDPKQQQQQQQQQELVVTILEETSCSPCVSLDLNISFDDNDDDNDNNNDSADQDHSIDDIGLLESVDRRIIFKIQEL